MFTAAEHSHFSLHHIFGKILYLVRIIATVLASGFLFYGIINVREEYSVYKTVQEMIDVQMKRYVIEKGWMRIPIDFKSLKLRSSIVCIQKSSEWGTFFLIILTNILWTRMEG